MKENNAYSISGRVKHFCEVLRAQLADGYNTLKKNRVGSSGHIIGQTPPTRSHFTKNKM